MQRSKARWKMQKGCVDMSVKTRATKKEIADTFKFYDIMSGKRNHEAYLAEKRRIERLAMSHEEYEAAIKDAARRYRV